MPSNHDMIIVTNVYLRKLKAFLILFVSNIGMRRALFHIHFTWHSFGSQYAENKFTNYISHIIINKDFEWFLMDCIGIKMIYKTKMNRLNMEKIERWWANLFNKLQYDIVLSMSEWKLDWTSFYNFINSCRIYYIVYYNNNWDSDSS